MSSYHHHQHGVRASACHQHNGLRHRALVGISGRRIRTQPDARERPLLVAVSPPDLRRDRSIRERRRSVRTERVVGERVQGWTPWDDPSKERRKWVVSIRRSLLGRQLGFGQSWTDGQVNTTSPSMAHKLPQGACLPTDCSSTGMRERRWSHDRPVAATTIIV